MKKNTPQGFTLVELIVVITILAVLGTIAFISLESYTTYARNAIRLDSTNKIVRNIKNLVTSGMNALSFADTGNEVPGASIAGTGAVVGVDYISGIPNYSALGVDREDFLDPLTGNDYRVGIVTTRGGRIEVTGSLEEGTDFEALVVGDWNPRQVVIVPGTGLNGNNNFTVANPASLGAFNVGDVLSSDGGDLLTVRSVSADGLTYFFNGSLSADATTLALAQSEVAGLVVSQDGVTPVVQGSTTSLAYGGEVECRYANFDDPDAVVEESGEANICFL